MNARDILTRSTAASALALALIVGLSPVNGWSQQGGGFQISIGNGSGSNSKPKAKPTPKPTPIPIEEGACQFYYDQTGKDENGNPKVVKKRFGRTAMAIFRPKTYCAAPEKKCEDGGTCMETSEGFLGIMRVCQCEKATDAVETPTNSCEEVRAGKTVLQNIIETAPSFHAGDTDLITKEIAEASEAIAYLSEKERLVCDSLSAVPLE